MSKLIIIRAAPGTGKTSVANILHNRADAKTVLLPRDLFHVEIIKDRRELRTAVNDVYFTAIAKFLEADAVVICEGAFYSEFWHESFKKIEQELKPETFHFFLKASLETVLDRARNRKKADILTDDMIRGEYAGAKPLGWENEHVIDTEDKSLEEVVAEIAEITGLKLVKGLKGPWYSDSFHPDSE